MDELNEQDQHAVEMFKRLNRTSQIAVYAMIAHELGYPAPRPDGVSIEDCKNVINSLHELMEKPDVLPKDIERCKTTCSFIWRNWVEGRTGEI